MKIRRPVAEDLAAIAQAIAADPDHAGQDASFFVSTGSEESGPDGQPGGELGAPHQGAECMVVEDEAGVVFYARLEHVLRVHLQFVPYTDLSPREKARIAIGIRNGLGWLQQRAATRGLRELIFSSTMDSLIRFCGKLGFRKSPHELVSNVSRLAVAGSYAAQTGATKADTPREQTIKAHTVQARG